MAQKRDPETGKFLPGGSGGPGRPPKEREIRYYQILMTTVSFEDWKEIVEKARDQAKRGDFSARKWLSEYLVGKPDENLNLNGIRIIVEHVGEEDLSP